MALEIQVFLKQMDRDESFDNDHNVIPEGNKLSKTKFMSAFNSRWKV